MGVEDRGVRWAREGQSREGKSIWRGGERTEGRTGSTERTKGGQQSGRTKVWGGWRDEAGASSDAPREMKEQEARTDPTVLSAVQSWAARKVVFWLLRD